MQFSEYSLLRHTDKNLLEIDGSSPLLYKLTIKMRGGVFITVSRLVGEVVLLNSVRALAQSRGPRKRL